MGYNNPMRTEDSSRKLASGIQSFPLFNQLPAELRRMVWSLALCPLENKVVRFLEIRFDFLSHMEALVFAADEAGHQQQSPSATRRYASAPRRHPRDQTIGNLRLVNVEANEMASMMYKRLPTLEIQGNSMPYRRTYLWVCPAHDTWTWNAELGDEGNTPTSQDWDQHITPVNSPRTLTIFSNLNEQGHQILQSIHHLRLGFLSLAEYTEHNMVEFFAVLPNLKTVSILLRQALPPSSLMTSAQLYRFTPKLEQENTSIVEQCLRLAILAVYNAHESESTFLRYDPGLSIIRELQDIYYATHRDDYSLASKTGPCSQNWELELLFWEIHREVAIAALLGVNLHDWGTFFHLWETLRSLPGVEVALATLLSSIEKF